MGKTITFLGAVSLVVVIIFSVIRWYGLKAECSDYLKLSADAPSIQKADHFLGEALKYLERKKLTKGNSAFLFRTPSNDVGIWYEQIKGAKETTEDILKRDSLVTVAQLEKDNALMKVREVILDEGSSGTEVTLPAHLTTFPYQWLFFLWWIFTVIVLIIGIIVWRREY